MKGKENVTPMSETSHVLLNETMEYAGKFFTAYALLQEAERNNDEDAFASAWGELMTALFVLKDKVEQAHEHLDKEMESQPD